VRSGARIVESFGQQASKAVGNYATNKARELRQQGNEEEARKWDEGGAYRVALHGSVGLLGGDVSGALGATAGARLMPQLGEAIAELNLPEPVRQGLTAVVGTAVGALAGSAGGNAAAGGTAALNETANNYLSRSPFASVRRAVSQENARLMNECGAHCTQADFHRIDQQMATLERSLNLSTLASRSTLSPEQAQQFTQTLLELAPVYGTGESFVQLLTGKSSVTGEEASRFWAAVGVVPVAGGLIKKVGEPSVEALTQFFKGADTIKPVATPAEAAAAPSALKAAQLHSELNSWTKIVPDTSRDAEYLAKTDRSVLQQYNFDMNHVLAGEINKSHKATGYHAEFAADGAARINPDAQVVYHPNGTYEAQVQIFDASKGQWVEKERKSTFFPPSWSQARIEYEVAEAFKNRTMQGPSKWSGISPSGIPIEGYINTNRVTFYPKGQP
jgi:hypothetical protein